MELEQAYSNLSLPYGASLEEIKKAFHAKAQQHHPDHLPESASIEEKLFAEEQFKLLNEAHHTLIGHIEKYGSITSKEQKRTEFDTRSDESFDINRFDRGVPDRGEHTMRNLWIFAVLLIVAFVMAAAIIRNNALLEAKRIQARTGAEDLPPSMDTTKH